MLLQTICSLLLTTLLSCTADNYQSHNDARALGAVTAHIGLNPAADYEIEVSLYRWDTIRLANGSYIRSGWDDRDADVTHYVLDRDDFYLDSIAPGHYDLRMAIFGFSGEHAGRDALPVRNLLWVPVIVKGVRVASDSVSYVGAPPSMRIPSADIPGGEVKEVIWEERLRPK